MDSRIYQAREQYHVKKLAAVIRVPLKVIVYDTECIWKIYKYPNPFCSCLKF